MISNGGLLTTVGSNRLDCLLLWVWTYSRDVQEMSELPDGLFLQLEFDSAGLWKTLEQLLNDGSLNQDNIEEVLLEETPNFIKIGKIVGKEV